MTDLVLTAVGDDREGLIAALSQVVEAHGGNWLDSEFARLAGKFAGVVLVSVPQHNVLALTQDAAALEQSVGWTINVTQAGGDPGEGQQVQVNLVGADRPGMVRSVSAALAGQRASITRFHSWTSDAPQGGGRLFEAEAVVRLPAGADVEALRDALEPIANELMVDLDLIQSA